MLVAVGCDGADWWMYIRNDSNAAWLLRVDTRGHTRHGHPAVARIDPGANGPGVPWNGDQENTVEVLALDCTVIGTLTSADGVTYALAAVPGLIGHIEAGTTPWGGNRSPGIQDMGICGGQLFVD
jgi:hypothetical protein